MIEATAAVIEGALSKICNEARIGDVASDEEGSLTEAFQALPVGT